MKLLKVCGIRHNPQEIAVLQPNYMGFIFWKPSARYFEGDLPNLPPSIKKVGVFVNAPLEDVLEKVAYYHLNAVQLHGEESPEYCKTLRHNTNTASPSEQEALKHPLVTPTLSFLRKQESTPKKAPQQAASPNEEVQPTPPEIIKAFSIKDRFDFSRLQPYEAVCDYFLFDTKGKLPGGNGYAFNWNVLKAYPATKPYFLSGGIGLENIDDLLAFLQRPEAQYCHAIDINSKFETQPGHKDLKKLKAFKNAIL